MNNLLRNLSKLPISTTSKNLIFRTQVNLANLSDNMLVDNPDFKWLRDDLGLDNMNHGVAANAGLQAGQGASRPSLRPSTGEVIAETSQGNMQDYESAVKAAQEAYKVWAKVPAPQRGDIVRQIGEALRKYKHQLGDLESIEVGKIKVEGAGEVQEFIDVCDFACGLSRSLDGKIFPSERPDHTLEERWQPLGIVGIITAFNFPVAVFGWNAAIALITGNVLLHKPAPTTNLSSIAIHKIVQDVLKENNMPAGICTLVCGDADIGQKISEDNRINLVSFTGSTHVGREVSCTVERRFGRKILELGGNNAAIVMPDADLDLVVNACTFSAVGTTGQRCTSLRRIFLHEDVYDKVVPRLVGAYNQIIEKKVGDPLDENTLYGPMHSEIGIQGYLNAIDTAKKDPNANILVGGKRIERAGCYVEPTLIAGLAPDNELVCTETFAPIAYLFKFKDLDEAIEYNNMVEQGLSSSLFTYDLKNIEKWKGPFGSDCGIVNVNIGTSGAEIGGAFGGNKATGWGRESGSDAWKQYVRMSTCTANFGSDLPLAQGINFSLE